MKTLLVALAFSLSLAGIANPAKFYAVAKTQAQFPTAFALPPEGAAALPAIEAWAVAQRDALVAALEADAGVIAAIRGWDELSVPEQVPFLRQVFAIETATLGIQPPELVIGDGVTPGAAYFDFDPDQGGTGRVLLNTAALAREKNPYVSLALLIHETRHSAQFQLPSKTFDAAFRAQKKLTGKLTFCDFMTLLNEYEAFQFGNYVVGKLTAWNVRMPDMGTFASQYDEHGELKIDLIALGAQVGAAGLLDAFNAAEKAQYDLLHGT